MADVSHSRGDIANPPDAPEMRERYARMLGGRDVALVDGPVYSPDAGVALNNIIIGALAVLLGLMCTVTAAKSAPRP
ncbi:hypothetical protein [Streptomyces sp. NPDC003015]